MKSFHWDRVANDFTGMLRTVFVCPENIFTERLYSQKESVGVQNKEVPKGIVVNALPVPLWKMSEALGVSLHSLSFVPSDSQ